MYIAITGSKNNKDVYIYRSFRKENGKASSCIYKKLGNLYTADQILETLRSMQMTLLNTASGYIPSYTRTELTDALHKIFDFRTDHEFITKADMRTLIKNTKQIKSKQG